MTQIFCPIQFTDKTHLPRCMHSHPSGGSIVSYKFLSSLLVSGPSFSIQKKREKKRVFNEGVHYLSAASSVNILNLKIQSRSQRHNEV